MRAVDVRTERVSTRPVQVLKHGRRINFKDDASTTTTTVTYTNGPASDDGLGGDGEENGVGSHVTNFSHCLQALAECAGPTASSASDAFTDRLVGHLPRYVTVARAGDGLVPDRCLQGLALAARHPGYHLGHVEVELLPHHAHHSGGILAVARALSLNPHLHSLVVRWHTLPLLVSFLTAALAAAPSLHNVLLHDAGGPPRRAGAGAGPGGRNVSAATWAGLQEACGLLRHARSVTLSECRTVSVVAQWVLYLPNTVRAFHFPGCSFNAISAADLGAKVRVVGGDGDVAVDGGGWL